MDIETWTWLELVALAGTPAKAKGLIRDGQVWRVFHGVYVGAEHLDTPAVRAVAVRRVVRPDVALTGRASLWILGVDALDLDGTIDLATPRGKAFRGKPGVRQHQLEVDESELFDLDGLLVVTPAKAAVDVARFEGLIEGVVLGDQALRAGLADLALLQAAVDRTAGLKGVVAARAMIPQLEPRSESAMETRIRLRVVQGGLPRPRAQRDAYRANGTHVGRADLEVDGVVLLYDGYDVHEGRLSFAKDRSQRNEYEAIGLVTRVFTADDYFRRPPRHIVDVVQAALLDARGRSVTAVDGRDTLRPPRLSPPTSLAAKAAAAERAA
jgi:hypothetical protein